MDQSMTNDDLVRSLTFIIHVNTNSIAMWETLPNNADWDYFKTPILWEILRTQNLLLVEHCALLEVVHLFQEFGCARNKLQFRRVQQNQDYEWMDCLLSIFGTWRWKCYIHRKSYHQPINLTPKSKSRRGKLRARQCPLHQVEGRRWPKRWWVVKSRSCDHKRTFFSRQSPAVHFWR